MTTLCVCAAECVGDHRAGKAGDDRGLGKEVGRWSWKANDSDLGRAGFLQGGPCCWGEMKIAPKFSHIFTFTLKNNRKTSTSLLFYICPDPFAWWLLVTSAAKAFLRHCENGRLGEGGGWICYAHSSSLLHGLWIPYIDYTKYSLTGTGQCWAIRTLTGRDMLSSCTRGTEVGQP